MSKINTILVIDDSEDDRLLFQRALKKSADFEYRVLEAGDGEEGLVLIKEKQPDCVLLDYSLPGRNGVEVLKRIRSQNPFTPVVMLTGQGNEKVAVNAIQEGAQNYISKNMVTPEALQRIIRVAIEHCALHKRIHEQRASLEIFTRALAHDLKEPVRTIRSFIDLVVSHEKLSERGKGYFDYMRNAADRMSTLIDTVYFYTRLDGSNEKISSEECDVGRVVEEAKENLNELIRERGATITSDHLPVLQGNRMQLIQIMQNLLCNAIRHCEQSPAIHIAAEEGVSHWLFRVSDNGPGIGGEYHEKIFEPFKRMSRHAQGLGLGLAICRKIVESHGGKIWYEPQSGGGGATFLFTLPKEAAIPVPGRKERPQAMTNVSQQSLGTILLVEDNDADIELARIMLVEEAQLQCNFIIARDGREALERLHEAGQPIDLLLLDINMPGMDGFELLKRMRNEDGLKLLPVVMCTTSTYDKDMDRAKGLGVAGYMTKPAGLNKLKLIIDNINGVSLSPLDNGFALLRTEKSAAH